jgi:CheY-like chemotaxis protein
MLLGPESPKADGLEVLKRGRADSGLKTIPAVMLVSSREGQDLVSAHDSRANVCIIKPSRFHYFVDGVREPGLFWTSIGRLLPGTAGRRH